MLNGILKKVLFVLVVVVIFQNWGKIERVLHPSAAVPEQTRASARVVLYATEWCGYCRAAERHIEPAVAAHPDVPVLGVEDGPGRPVGRSYRVKLWPTLIFLNDGAEVARVVRPGSRAEVDEGYAALTGAD